MEDLIEMRIISAVRELLSGKVDELLGDLQFFIPLVEFGIIQARTWLFLWSRFAHVNGRKKNGLSEWTLTLFQ